jgi:hypothetical protein
MKRFGAKLCAAAIASVLALGMSGGVWAARVGMEVKSLKGLSGVCVVVESLAPDISRDGLSTELLRKTVSSRLSMGGVSLLTEDQLSQPGAAIFYISITSVKSDLGLYACNVHAEVIQAAALSRDPKILTPATTWTSGSVGIVGAANVKQLADTVAGIADEFVKDFLSVNSKQPPKPKIA